MTNAEERCERLLQFADTLIAEKAHWIKRAMKAERIIALWPLLFVLLPVVFLIGYIVGVQ